MYKYSIRSLLLLVAIVASFLWWTDDGFRIILQEHRTQYGRLTIWARSSKPRQTELRLKFSQPTQKAGELYTSESIMVDIPATDLELKSIVDSSNSLWCIYDKSGASFVFLAYPGGPGKGSFKNFYHSGMHLGWARGIWIDIFAKLTKSCPEVKYSSLP